jgi:hypothetical protein
VLIGRRWSIAQRLMAVAGLTGIACLPALVWWLGAHFEFWPMPKASGPIGVTSGLVGGAIVLFEMLYAPRKWLRGRRFGAAKLWLRWHVYLGFAVIPIIIIHSGFAFGGWLSSVTMALFLITIVSGVVGLAFQQMIPQTLLNHVPTEWIATQPAAAFGQSLTTFRPAIESANVPMLSDFVRDEFEPFLASGRGPLARANDATKIFQRLKSGVPTAIEPLVDDLATLATSRRLFRSQQRLYFWLHVWLVVHLPLSVAMSLVMIVHAVLAMRWL